MLNTRRVVALVAAALTVAGAVIADDFCTPPEHSTLTSICYGACSSSLCVNYASSAAEDRSKESSDAGFFYRGCSTANMPTCKANVTSGGCQVQCLVNSPASWSTPQWTLTIAQPQSDKTDTAVFQQIDDLTLPTTLQNLTIVGATTSSQITVPLSFSSDAFRNGTALQQLVISDVNVGDILTNIFPDSLRTLIIQRAKLTQFDPRGSHAFTSVSTLDLRDNQLSDIPTIIYEMRNLSALYLQGNSIANAHVTLPQLKYLQELPVFEANLTVDGSCSFGYEAVSWGDKKICYTNGDGLGSINSSGSKEKSTSSTASENSSTSVVLYVVLGLVFFIVLAVAGGVVLLRRWKQKNVKEQHDSLVSADGNKIKANLKSLRARIGVNGTMQTTELETSLNDYTTGGGLRKAPFKEIPVTDMVMLNQLSTSGPVVVALAEYRTKLVLVTKLQPSDDDVEAALDMVPTLSQMRHPQLLSITGLVWDDRHAMTAVCEYMTLGTLEAYLRSAGSKLNWKNFKMKAAAEIARGLMYLHSQHMVTYDGLNGRSVFVDPDKGCKLNPIQAALPTDGSSPYSCQSYYRRCDSTSKAFFAPEILIGEPSRSSSDMYAFGVLLAHLDTCQTADEMIRSSWRMRTHIGDFDTDNGTLLSTDGTVVSTNTSDSDNSRRRTTHLESLPSANNNARILQSSRSLALEENRRRTTPVLGTHNNDETSFMSMFTFTPECPTMVKELAGACLQYDPSLRPSASYIAAMLHI
ncbi:serine/threonine protein kinase, variant 2 [Phytophthora nicotianae P10297]|uniref:Serine/threonine protein kinase n=2 Tax=Phytophthora nicotianae TaxID=4792 RepID=W2Z570_PHYNI|nr:serine/threonine protein kinase [Phytophthora nicotianae]ETP41357.1 serine/threonine protein kinase [Phytophthora nicotianae P10297]ETL90129.1 serine/threonine protein kinase, variant 1 [Phytophthora nicotianae]ETL90130.1 serine/threonine protein kinase, variant 2 [Phytophthora nicotianae]ETM43417.1 serine/threonine protein kinase [Phytophthora nicotianae]